MAAQGGWGPLKKQSKNNCNKRRHLVQRLRLLMDVKPHGFSACRVYQHVKEEDWQLAAKTWFMPRGEKKPQVTKRQILAWREEALQAELELSPVVLGLPDDASYSI